MCGNSLYLIDEQSLRNTSVGRGYKTNNEDTVSFESVTRRWCWSVYSRLGSSKMTMDTQ